MIKQWLGVSVVTAAVAAAMAASPEAQQNAAPGTAALTATGSTYAPPRTPWGDPDIQGGYSNVNENGIPLEKPGALGDVSIDDIDDSEFAEIIRERNERAAASAAGIGGRETGAGPTHWYEHYNARNSRPWMLSDPEDGRIPMLTAAAQQRQGARGGGRGRGAGEGGRANSWLDRSYYDRCITRGFPGSMMPAIYGNAYDITQAPGLVAIRYEMIHETRVIRLDETPRTGIPSHMGEARGRWEGNTLVVETTNFDPRTVYRQGSPNMRLIERFTPTAPGVLEWSMTVVDPDTWTRPWTFGMRLTEDATQSLFEYACHEGNYAMRNILSAGRADDEAAAATGQR
jgi:hypothetical protein